VAKQGETPQTPGERFDGGPKGEFWAGGECENKDVTPIRSDGKYKCAHHGKQIITDKYAQLRTWDRKGGHWVVNTIFSTDASSMYKVEPDGSKTLISGQHKSRVIANQGSASRGDRSDAPPAEIYSGDNPVVLNVAKIYTHFEFEIIGPVLANGRKQYRKEYRWKSTRISAEDDCSKSGTLVEDFRDCRNSPQLALSCNDFGYSLKPEHEDDSLEIRGDTPQQARYCKGYVAKAHS
jgi:hypothetical protein